MQKRDTFLQPIRPLKNKHKKSKIFNYFALMFTIET